MPRDGRIVRGRLEQAALDLFAEHGFDGTTTEQIAARAGVTERTYFRHFPDKREVLFASEEELREVTVAAIESIPAGVEPLEALHQAFHDVVPLLVRNRQLAALRAPIIMAAPALREREHAKTAALIDLVQEALVKRNIDERSALLCARVGMGVFSTAIRRWATGSATDLHDEVDGAFADLATMAASLDERRPA